MIEIDILDNKELLIINATTEYEKNIISNALTVELPDAWRLKKINDQINTERKFLSEYGTAPVGLWLYILQTCKNCNMQVNIKPKMVEYIQQFHFDFDKLKKFVDATFKGAKNDKGKPFAPYEYQIQAAYKLLKFQKCCAELSTSAGKTLISFIIFKYLLEVEHINKILYIVPSKSLSEQSGDDYKDYERYLRKHNTPFEIGILRSGLKKKEREKVDTCNILFGTFQSLVRKDISFLSKFQAVIVDECLDGDSMIDMADGTQKKIKDCAIGDKVIVYNEDSRCEEVKEIEYVYHGLSANQDKYVLKTEFGKELIITGNHKVLTVTKYGGLKWFRVDELTGNERVQTRYGDFEEIASIEKIGTADTDVYNLRIKSKSLVYCHNYFANGICVSNCHHSSSASIKTILTKCTNLKYLMGCSGTIPENGTYENMVIQSYIGPVVHKFTADELINKEHKATPVYVIYQLLDWARLEEKKTLWLFRNNKDKEDVGAGAKLLKQEQEFVNNSYERMKYIADLAIRVKGNLLILFGDIKGGYGRKVYQYLKDNCDDKDIYYTDGETPVENRNWIIEQMENSENDEKYSICVASIYTFSEGISIKRLHSIFLINSIRSWKTVRQIIGRGLRLYEGKDKVVLFDFVDDLRYSENGRHSRNYLYKQYEERKKTVESQKFPVFVQKVNFENTLL